MDLSRHKFFEYDVDGVEVNVVAVFEIGKHKLGFYHRSDVVVGSAVAAAAAGFVDYDWLSVVL